VSNEVTHPLSLDALALLRLHRVTSPDKTVSFAKRNKSDESVRIATLFTRAEAVVGESPLWDAAAQRLWWTDLAGGRLLASDHAGRRTHDERLGDTLGAVVFRAGGGLTAALDGGVTAVEDGHLRRIADLDLDDRRLRVNDAACDPAGRLWVGVVGTEPERAAGALHVLHGDRALPVLDGLSFPNGFDWSPDGSILYLAESDARRVGRFAFDADGGRLGARETFVELPADDGLPDGITVDEDGGVWVAIWGAGEVRRYSPAGELTATVACPVSQTSSCAFGGPDRRTLYVTSAREGLSSAALGAQPLAGSVFHTRVPHAGLPPRVHTQHH
jgi:sugar lactone lactonase YvrE